MQDWIDDTPSKMSATNGHHFFTLLNTVYTKFPILNTSVRILIFKQSCGKERRHLNIQNQIVNANEQMLLVNKSHLICQDDEQTPE